MAKNGEAETEKEVAETEEVVEKKTEEIVSTNGTKAKNDMNDKAVAEQDKDG